MRLQPDVPLLNPRVSTSPHPRLAPLQTPLHLAAAGGHQACVAALLSAGARQTYAKSGRNPFDEAMLRGHHGVAAMLVETEPPPPPPPRSASEVRARAAGLLSSAAAFLHNQSGAWEGKGDAAAVALVRLECGQCTFARAATAPCLHMLAHVRMLVSIPLLRTHALLLMPAPLQTCTRFPARRRSLPTCPAPPARPPSCSSAGCGSAPCA